jgi:hypothetical protein
MLIEAAMLPRNLSHLIFCGFILLRFRNRNRNRTGSGSAKAKSYGSGPATQVYWVIKR